MTTLSISGFSPPSGGSTTKVTIYGSGFLSANNVLFNKTEASSFRPPTDSKIYAYPAQGTTTGYITVETSNGNAQSSTVFTISEAPTLDTFTTSGHVGDTVTLSGTNLSATSQVQFGAKAAVSTPTSMSDTQVQVPVPDNAITGPITVVTPGGQATTSSNFTLEQSTATNITFDPTGGPPNTPVFLSGDNLGSTTGVLFGGTSATEIHISSTATSVSVTAWVPDNAISGPITVTNSGGVGVSTQTFTVTPAPEITKIYPTSGKLGDSVTLTGRNFVNVSQVTFGSNYATATPNVKSETEIDVTVPPGAVTGAITVTTDAGQAISETFTVESSAAPTINSDGLDPTYGNTGTPVTITGTNFTGVTGATLGITKIPALRVISDTKMVVPVPANSSSGQIEVTNTEGTATSSQTFTIIDPPTINSNSPFSPNNGTVGTPVTIYGTNFYEDEIFVAFSGTRATPVTVNSALTEIQAKVPAGASSGKITVTTLGGTAISSDAFTVNSSDAPNITGFLPSSGGAYQRVTISGSNFTGTTSVKFTGNTETAKFIVNSDKELTVTVPNPNNNPTKSGPITVTNTEDSTTSGDSFTFYSAPTLNTLTITKGTKGTSVPLSGTNFTESASVHFNALSAEVSFTSTTALTATVPDGATNGPIIVQTEGGVARSAENFDVESSGEPTITGFADPSASVAQVVTIGGTNFTGVTGVYFSGVSASASFTVTSDTLLKATVPIGASTGPVKVKNTIDTATSSDDLTILVAPTLDADKPFSPSSGSPGTSVTIYGNNFINVKFVLFTPNVRASFKTDSTQQITATVPDNAKTGPIRVVTRAGQVSSTSVQKSFNVN